MILTKKPLPSIQYQETIQKDGQYHEYQNNIYYPKVLTGHLLFIDFLENQK